MRIFRPTFGNDVFQQNQQMEHAAKLCFRHSESLPAPNVSTFFFRTSSWYRTSTYNQGWGAKKKPAGREKILQVNSALLPFDFLKQIPLVAQRFRFVWKLSSHGGWHTRVPRSGIFRFQHAPLPQEASSAHHFLYHFWVVSGISSR